MNIRGNFSIPWDRFTITQEMLNQQEEDSMLLMMTWIPFLEISIKSHQIQKFQIDNEMNLIIFCLSLFFWSLTRLCLLFSGLFVFWAFSFSRSLIPFLIFWAFRCRLILHHHHHWWNCPFHILRYSLLKIQTVLHRRFLLVIQWFLLPLQLILRWSLIHLRLKLRNHQMGFLRTPRTWHFQHLIHRIDHLGHRIRLMNQKSSQQLELIRLRPFPLEYLLLHFRS